MSTSTEKKSPIKRDHSLNDATSGQMREEHRLVHESEPSEGNKNPRRKAARKLSREV